MGERAVDPGRRALLRRRDAAGRQNQLVSDIHGQLSGGGGFADSYYLPLILGWNKERASIRALAGFLAPTGRFAAGASDNVGSGYWTPTLSSGQTVQIAEQ